MHILTTRAVRSRIYLLRRALHPIRRHYTPSVRVQRHVTGAAPPIMFMTLATTVGMFPRETADSDRRRPALEPPTGTAAGPSDTLHTSNTWSADRFGTLFRSPSRHRHRPQARQPDPAWFLVLPHDPADIPYTSGAIQTGDARCAGIRLGADSHSSIQSDTCPRIGLLPMRRYTRSVGITPLLFGCGAT